MLEKRGVELCLKPPGFEEDPIVRTDCRTLAFVHLGRLSLTEARRQGRWEMEGPRDLVRAFPTWGGLSYFARASKARPVRAGA